MAGNMDVTCLPEVIARSTSAPKVTEPCAQVNAASASFKAANPTVWPVVVDSGTLYSCLRSIPIHKQEARAFLLSIFDHYAYAPQVPLLKSLPSGLWANNIREAAEGIVSSIEKDLYHGEYDFQTDVRALLQSARGSPVRFVGDLTSISRFTVPMDISLVSVSVPNGLPLIYLDSDSPSLSFENGHIAPELHVGSSISTINGYDSAPYLMERGKGSFYSSWNEYGSLLYFDMDDILASEIGSHSHDRSYPGPGFDFQFHNGTTKHVEAKAELYVDFAGVIDGHSAYQKLVNASGTSLDQERATLAERHGGGSQATLLPRLYGFVPPVVTPSTTGATGGAASDSLVSGIFMILAVFIASIARG